MAADDATSGSADALVADTQEPGSETETAAQRSGWSLRTSESGGARAGDPGVGNPGGPFSSLGEAGDMCGGVVLVLPMLALAETGAASAWAALQTGWPSAWPNDG
jgi:hypothetical protein